MVSLVALRSRPNSWPTVTVTEPAAVQPAGFTACTVYVVVCVGVTRGVAEVISSMVPSLGDQVYVMPSSWLGTT